ncbi:MAG: hypothetical protein EOO73_28880 [Myxococcales bacterium]|nr:MAG: hypothetical protein EOO73_28880 [Myxococcales bacterium]
MTKAQVRWVAIGGAAALLVVALAVFASRRMSSPRGAPAAATQAPTAPARVFAPRHYAEPLVPSSDLELTDDEHTEDDADSAATSFKPREDRPAWKLEPPIAWDADPFKDRNWQFQLHSLAMVRPLLARYAATADSARYHQAVAFAVDWWRFHGEQGKQADYSWYDMATGKRATILAYLLDRAFAGKEKLSEAEQRSLLAMAGAHVTKLRDRKFIVMTNHGLFQIQGVASLCRVLGDVGDCEGSDAYVQKQLGKLLDTQFDAYGVHREHSPQYHRLAIQALSRFAQPQGTGVYKEIAQRLELARAVFPWLVFPDGRLATLGDTEGEAPDEPPPPSRKCTEKDGEACVEVGDFSKSGYVVVRSPWSRPKRDAFMLIMTGMYNRSTHKHADDLSFELMEHGELLLEDSGKYAYLKDKMNKHVHTARAHTTVGLADREIVVGDAKAYGSALEPPERDGNVHVLRGQVRRKKLFTQTRRVDYAPGRYLLIDDELNSPDAREFESYVHLARQLEAKADGAAFIVPLAGGRRMRVEALSADCKSSQARGQNEPQLQGWVTKAYREMTPASVLTFGCAGKDRHITLLLSFDESSRTEGLARAAKTRVASSP